MTVLGERWIDPDAYGFVETLLRRMKAVERPDEGGIAAARRAYAAHRAANWTAHVPSGGAFDGSPAVFVVSGGVNPDMLGSMSTHEAAAAAKRREVTLFWAPRGRGIRCVSFKIERVHPLSTGSESCVAVIERLRRRPGRDASDLAREILRDPPCTPDGQHVVAAKGHPAVELTLSGFSGAWNKYASLDAGLATGVVSGAAWGGRSVVPRGRFGIAFKNLVKRDTLRSATARVAAFARELDPEAMRVLRRCRRQTARDYNALAVADPVRRERRRAALREYPLLAGFVLDRISRANSTGDARWMATKVGMPDPFPRQIMDEMGWRRDEAVRRIDAGIDPAEAMAPALLAWEAASSWGTGRDPAEKLRQNGNVGDAEERAAEAVRSCRGVTPALAGRGRKDVAILVRDVAAVDEGARPRRRRDFEHLRDVSSNAREVADLLGEERAAMIDAAFRGSPPFAASTCWNVRVNLHMLENDLAYAILAPVAARRADTKSRNHAEMMKRARIVFIRSRDERPGQIIGEIFDRVSSAEVVDTALTSPRVSDRISCGNGEGNVYDYLQKFVELDDAELCAAWSRLADILPAGSRLPSRPEEVEIVDGWGIRIRRDVR